VPGPDATGHDQLTGAPGDATTVVGDYYAALNERDDAVLLALLSEDFEPGVPGFRRGRGPWLAMLAEHRAAFPDLHTDVAAVFGAGGQVCAVTWTEGTHLGPFLGHAPTGRRFRAQGIDVFRVEGGVLAAREGVYDTFAMLHQLGLINPGAPP
jgi:steroid delta-isomerase-like uncharacterized protein